MTSLPVRSIRFVRVTLLRLLAIVASLLLGVAPALAAPVANLSRAVVAFGVIPLSVPIVQPVFLTNTGDAPLPIAALALSGASASEFLVGGTCVASSALAPNGRCRIEISAVLLGLANTSTATLTIQFGASVPAATIGMSATGATDIAQGLVASPPWVDFPPQDVGTSASLQTVTITNPESTSLTIDSVVLSGGSAGDFTLSTGCSTGMRMARGATCTATVGFVPAATGPRSTELRFNSHVTTSVADTVNFRWSVTGVGRQAGVVVPTGVVEYYNAVLDHYFITWVAAEQANLDAGNTPTKWTRTGQMLTTYTTPQSGTSPVCRYYIPPAKGDSHFFGRGTAECDATGKQNPTFVLEDPDFMNMFLPVAGVCPAGTMNVYRVFSNRADANHRYMTDRAIRDAMVAKGWIAEGDGPDLVVMCAPL